MAVNGLDDRTPDSERMEAYLACLEDFPQD